MNRLIQILIFVFLLGSCSWQLHDNIHRDLSSTNRILNLSDIRNSHFYQRLVRTYQVVVNPDIPHNEKSLHIDEIFLQLKSLCEKDCSKVIETLNTINSDFAEKLKSEESRELIESVNLRGQKLIGDRIDLSPDQLQKMSVKAKEVLQYIPKEDAAHKVNASLQLLRYVIALEEKALFELLSKGSSSTQGEEIQQSLAIYKKQYEALHRLYQVFNKYGGDGLSEIPIDEMKVLVNSINDLGLFYMKLAQSVSNNHMLFNEEQKDLLKSFQDDIAPMDSKEVLEIIENELGRPASEAFIDFDPDKPLATGTIAQTYVAKVKTLFGSKEVIVKVQRPHLQDVLDRNRGVNRVLTQFFQVFGTEKVAPYIDLLAGQILGLEDAFERELDFKKEASALRRFRYYFALHRNIKVPQSISSHSTSKVLTMEKIEGNNIDRVLESLTDDQLDFRHKIFTTLLDSLLYQTFFVGEVHADMHPGNILVGKGLGIIDLGQTFRSRGMIVAPVNLISSVLQGDSFAFSESVTKLGHFPNIEDYEKFRLYIDETFEKAGFKKGSLFDVIRNKDKIFTHNTDEEVLKVFAEIIQKMLSEYGFRADPQYVQFFRSLLPVISTLYAMGKEIPKKKLYWIMVSRGLMYTPVVLSSILSDRMLNASKNRLYRVRNALRSIPHKVEQGVRNCQQSFQLLLVR